VSIALNPERIARVRGGAQRLLDRAVDQEVRIEKVLSAAEEDVRRAETALSRRLELTQGCMDSLRLAVRWQLERSREGCEAARQLCVSAREQYVTAGRLVSDVDDRNAAERTAAQRTNQERQRRAVLVVDDYDDSREMLSLLLESAGFVVRTASNGLEALIAAYEMQPTVIVMDMTMPVLDGVEATRLIKAVDTIRHAQVIAYTATPSLDDGALWGLFAAILKKPAPPDVMVETVRQCANL
jgi:CheY-like chemotaxis protein